MSYKNAATAEELEAVIGGDVPVAEAEHAGSADSAAQAAKVGDANVGSSTRPVYLEGGTPKQCGNTLNVGISGKAATAGTADSAAKASQDGDGNVISETYAKQTGSYPNLGAGYLAKRAFVGELSGDQWIKWATVSAPAVARASILFLVNGGQDPNTEGSGLLELNFLRQIEDVSLVVCSGYIEAGNFAYVINGTSIDLYVHCQSYRDYQIAVLDELIGTTTNKNTYVTFSNVGTGSSTAPEGAVYAVNRNMAAYDGDGNAIASTYAKVDELSNETQLRTAADQAIMALIDDIEDGTTIVAKATTADKVGSADVGSSVLPVWVDNGTPKAVSIKTLTAKDDIGYDVTGDRSKLLTLSAIAFWNGAYQSTTSNLQYCAGGAIQPKPTLESKSIAASAWTALEGSDPFKFQANVTISKSLSGNVTLELLNDDLAAFRSYGYQIGAVSGQTVTIWAAAQPTAAVTLSFYIYTR